MDRRLFCRHCGALVFTSNAFVSNGVIAASTSDSPLVPISDNACKQDKFLACASTPTGGVKQDSIFFTADKVKNELRVHDSQIKPSSRIPNFDKAIGQVLINLSKIYDAVPGFTFWQENDGEANAIATDYDQFEGREGTIYFGLTFLNKYLSMQQDGDLVVLTVCAHEFSHIKQYERWDDFWGYLQGLPCYAPELHADFVAGYGLYSYIDEFAPGMVSGLQNLGRAWEGLADTPLSKQESHGSSKQRIDSIEAGYAYARMNWNNLKKKSRNERIWYAMSNGISYLKNRPANWWS